MSLQIGSEAVGEFARRQLEAARRDPRLDRGDGRALVADFWDAMEEAERVRTLGLMGLHELTSALEREEASLGVRRDADDLDAAAAAMLQAAYERAEWAKAELANESPHGNAQALISMNSALDAMVEELAKHWRAVQVERIVDEMLAKGRRSAGDAVESVDARVVAAVEDAVRAEVDRIVPKALKPKGSGIARYEKPLRRVGWGAPADRPIPEDLDAALAELGALRDVLVHRAGRVDEPALEQAPTLRYRAGHFVRISRQEYREYSAAIRCYAQEITFRGMRGWPEVNDERDGPHLARWRDCVRVNA
jgi:hypothetical protein